MSRTDRSVTPAVAGVAAMVFAAPVGAQAGTATSLPGARCTEICRKYAAFADTRLRNRSRPLLNGPSARFPEVSFVGPTGEEA